MHARDLIVCNIYITDIQNLPPLCRWWSDVLADGALMDL